MGKKLIIKGADFSENALAKLAIDCNDDIEITNESSYSNASPFADSRYANLFNKTVVGVEFKPARAGTITIVSLYNGVLSNVESLTITSEMIGVKTFFDLNVQVKDTEILGIMESNDSGSFYFNRRNSNGFITYLGKSSQTTRPYGLAVNWYVD